MNDILSKKTEDIILEVDRMEYISPFENNPFSKDLYVYDKKRKLSSNVTDFRMRYSFPLLFNSINLFSDPSNGKILKSEITSSGNLFLWGLKQQKLHTNRQAYISLFGNSL